MERWLLNNQVALYVDLVSVGIYMMYPPPASLTLRRVLKLRLASITDKFLISASTHPENIVNLLQRKPVALLLLWLVLVVISLISRSYIPIDETRYVTVAWNMWLRGDFLVPFLNGEAYSHKPPLLFWLMNIGWAVFGVNDWWPRLVPSFFALGSVFLTIRLARRLWPQDAQAAIVAPLILLGSALWTLFTTATMFDMLIAFFTLLGLLGILTAWYGKPFKGWILVSMAIGSGLLAKGPTILLQILPVAILAPWWGNNESHNWKHWYSCLLGATLFGACIVLMWAIPAGLRGGEEYRHAIFWGQTAERMVNSFAHKRPIWWYLPLLPAMLFPWLLWLPVWRGLASLRQQPVEQGIRFCIAWIVPVFVAFSFISGKQVHYLLPLFPAFALLAAHGLPQAGQSRFDQWPVGLVAIAVGAILAYLPHAGLAIFSAKGIPTWTGIAMMVAGVVLLVIHFSNMVATVWAMTAFSAFSIVVTVYAAVIHSAGLAYDIRPLAARLKALQDTGAPLAHVGEYYGQYQFVGRLVNEPEVLKKEQLEDWFKTHPNGKAIVYFSKGDLPAGMKLDYQQPYRGLTVVVMGHNS